MAVLMLAVRLTISLTLMVLLVSAGKKCNFNGKKFVLDDVAYQMPDNCAELKCVLEGKKARLQMTQMEGCSIEETSNKCTFNGKIVPVDKVAYQMTGNCAELKCVMEGNHAFLKLKRMEGCIIVDPEPTTPTPVIITDTPETSNKCTWNGKDIAVGDVAYQIAESCEELRCVMEGKKPVLKIKPMEGCGIVVPTLAPVESITLECKYKDFGNEHTMNLKPNKNCKYHKSGVTEEEKQIIIKMHNDLRSKVAQGQEKQGAPGPQPKASNMQELVWNDQLAEVAQAWAEQCPKRHDLYKNRRICNSYYKNVGQNIWNNFGHNDQHLWETAVQNWYDEVEFMHKKDVDAYRDPKKGVIAHYTQIVWAKTTEIGCGAIYYTAEINGVEYSNSKKYICNYGPAGNTNDATIYKKGKAASKCYLKNGKSKNFPFLCA